VLGHYDPRREPPAVKIDKERAAYWISKGAKPSETVRSLLKKNGAN
jgi:small subunit ribosomal protein S16